MLDCVTFEEGKGFNFEIKPEKEAYLKSKSELKHNLLENPIFQNIRFNRFIYEMKIK